MNIEHFNKIVRSDKKNWTYKEIIRLENKFYHSSIYYIKSLLEAQFPSLTFTLQGTKELLQEI